MRVAVIGGGIVGLSSAWALVEAGHDVTVYDPAPGAGATYAAAGMIAPAGEAWYGEELLLRLGLASASLWPAFAARLSAASGLDLDFRTSGTLLVGQDASDLAAVQRTVDLVRAHGIAAEPLTGAEARRLEPTLSDRMCGAALLRGDAQVNPRRVTEALLRVLGSRVVREQAGSPHADVTVVCTGTAAHPWIHPVRGEALRVRSDDPPARVVRGLVHGDQVYVVPRAGGELVIGATSSREAGPAEPTVGGVTRLLQAARTLLPSLDDATVLEVVARDRPGTPDNGPLIGLVSSAVVVAAGHYRGGVLLAPVTAQAVLALVAGRDVRAEVAPFHPHRFGPATQEALPA